MTIARITQAVTRLFRRPPQRHPSDDTTLLFWSEKLPLALAMAAQAAVVTRWYIGAHAPVPVPEILTWVNVVIAVAAGLALDLVVVTTVMARRKGRRGFWGIATAAAAAVASAFISLDVYGGWTPGPYLHVAYPVVVFLFSMHLSAPRVVAQDIEQLAHARATLAVLESDLAQARADAAQARASLAQRDQDIAHTRDHAAQQEQEAARVRQQLAQQASELAALSHTLPDAGDLDITAIAQRFKDLGMSWRDIEGLLHIPQSTLRARLKVRTNGHLVEA